MNTNCLSPKSFFSKKMCLSILASLFVQSYLSAATIHVDNKLADQNVMINLYAADNATYSKTIKPGASEFFNTGFSPIANLEWTINGVRWTGNSLTVKALETEGRLIIEKDGKYSFKPCLFCNEVTGQAIKMTRN